MANRFPALSLILCSLVLVGCRGREVFRLNRKQLPVRMEVGLPAGLVEREEAERVYSMELRRAMSQSMALASPDLKEPTPLITVEVSGRFSRKVIAKDATTLGAQTAINWTIYEVFFGWARGGGDLVNGALTGAGMGVLNGGLNYLGNQMEYKSHCKRLGYEPSLFKARVTFTPADGKDPQVLALVDSLTILALMQPLPEADRNNPAKRLEEEGRALGMAVWDRLTKSYSLRTKQTLAMIKG